MGHTVLLSLLLALTVGVSRAHTEPKTALIIIDVQLCFLSGGSLAVDKGDEVIPVINRIRHEYGSMISLVVLSQDWHCPGHVSFAASHDGKEVMDEVQLKYLNNGTLCLGDTINKSNFPTATTCGQGDLTELNQLLWPVHCVEDVTSGPTSSNLADSLHVESSDVVIKKGVHCEIDSYSAFFDNGGMASTGLETILYEAGIEAVFVTGLALDYCVYYTSKDAKKLGFETYTVLDASRAVAPDTEEAAKQDMIFQGIHLINSYDIGDAIAELRETNAGDPPVSYMMSFLVSAVAAAILMTMS